jgi:hypothetical protein
MSKAGSDSSPSTRLRSGRTYWVRRGLSPSAGKERASASRAKGGKRFVEPYRLSDAQRAVILGHLEEQGVGDPESRRLFAAAMEYDLAGCQVLVEPPGAAREPAPQPGPNDEALAALAETARSLADQLSRFDAQTAQRLRQGLGETDRFKRTYGEGYLSCLRQELLRIGSACEADTPRREVAAERAPEVNEVARRFVARAASAFGECFELKASSEQGSPFTQALEAIAAATGMRFPADQRTLADILHQG